MSYKWRTGNEIDAQIDRTIFEMKMKDYNWVKTLSVKPRYCYLSGEFIKPFTYTMVAHPEDPPYIENAMDELEVMDSMKKRHVYQWVSMESYVFHKLGGKI